MCDLVTQLYTHHGWQSDSEAQTSQTNEAMNDDKIRADEKDDRTCQSRDVSAFFCLTCMSSPCSAIVSTRRDKMSDSIRDVIGTRRALDKRKKYIKRKEKHNKNSMKKYALSRML